MTSKHRHIIFLIQSTATAERNKNVFTIYPGSRKRQCGMGCKARRAANSQCYWQASQRRRPPAMALALRVGAKSGDFFGHPLAWALAHAARMTFELIPIATQRDPG